MEKYYPQKDERGQELSLGDYCSVPLYPKGRVRGWLVPTAQKVFQGDRFVGMAVLLHGEDDEYYSVSAMVRKLKKPKKGE